MTGGEENKTPANVGGKPHPTKEQIEQGRKDRGEHVSGHKEGDGFGPGSSVEGGVGGADSSHGDAGQSGGNDE